MSLIDRSTDIRAALRRRQGGFLMNPFRFGGGAPAGDPHFANVSLLLHMDGTNGSTTFTDSSPTPKTVTANGNAQISTAQSRFGGASGLFDGAGDFLGYNGLALGTQDVTIEAWARFNSVSGVRPIASSRLNNGNSTAYWMLYVEDGILKFQTRVGTQYIASSTASISTGVWYHLAATRTSGVLRVFVGGIVGGTTANDGFANITENSIAVGLFNFSGFVSYFSGHIDDLRRTDGVARYTANFTPPIAPFPNF
ncbi:LamG domain-containing protein [Macromonas nakdongensis]|uniref:LamG domain-containing protein n=1 Tax=Macromonas nakdongensis TaxID=1843082 RepID=UPI000C324E98|nr:LamG domain-containing protein [Macromonas nakdongensis]